MKYLFFCLLSLFTTISYAQQHTDAHVHKMDSISAKTQQDTIKIAVLLYNDVVLEDFTGPMEVFSKAQNLTKGKYKTITVGLTSGKIATENNLLKIQPDYTLDNLPKVDYLIVPGASMPVIKELLKNAKLTSFIQKWNSNPSAKTVSICTAAYLLANTGILKGKNATTHYFVADDFEEQYPEIKLIRNVRYVEDQNIITSSGVTSGIDAALYIVGKHSGEGIQAMINRALQYNYGENEKWPVAPKGMRYRSN